MNAVSRACSEALGAGLALAEASKLSWPCPLERAMGVL